MNTNFFKQSFLKDDFTRYSSSMFIATTIAGALNYLYQIYMGRALGPEQYGTFGALFAIFYMTFVISQTVGISVTHHSARLTAKGKSLGPFFYNAIKRAAFFALISSLAFAILSPVISSFLKINVKTTLLLTPVLFLMWFTPLALGTLRGLQHFYKVGAGNIAEALLKLLTGVALVALGFGVNGAIAAISFGILGAFLLSFILLKPYLKNNPHSHIPEFKEIYSFSLPVLFAMICFSVPTNFDVILAKRFFSASDTGIYTSVSVLGKIIIFFPMAIYAVMFPMASKRDARGEDTSHLLKRSLLYTSVLTGTTALAYVLFPKLVLYVFGASYADALPLIGSYGLAMFFFSLTVVMMHYNLALRRLKYVYILAFFTLSEIVLLFLFHATPLQMIKIILGVNVLLFLSSLAYTWRWTDR